MSWTKAQERELTQLANQEKFFFTEIAEKIGKSPAAVRWKAKQLGLASSKSYLLDRMGKWNSKHSHLREPVMRYFMSHTAEETQKKFKLTQSEFKSITTVSYRDPKLKHLRKDKRNHNPWSAREFKFMLQHAGLKPRAWIAKRLKRGGPLGIKDRLETLGIASKSVNGITLSQFREAFGKEPGFYLETEAGPGRGKYSATYYKIIPWVWLDQEIKARRLKTAPVFRQLVCSMAMFQEWIFDGDALDKLQRICGQ